MKTIPIGTSPAGVRQAIVKATQIGGVLPERTVAGPILYAEPEPAYYHNGLYEYSEVKKYLVLGDPATPGGFITLRYQPSSVATSPEADWKCSVVIVDGAAESVDVRNHEIIITLDTGTSTYASVYATIIADANFAGKIIAILDGAGAVLAAAQVVQSFVDPTITPVVLTDGGLFRFGGEKYIELLGIHLELGVASVVDITVTDTDGVSHPRTINAGVSGADDYYTYSVVAPIPILPGQCVIIKESVTGVPVPANKCITLYAVTAQKR
jgi:hypothetical protein